MSKAVGLRSADLINLKKMITTNVAYRTMFLKYGNSTGTCFMIDVNEKQYVVTAKHVIAGIQDKEEVELFFNNAWGKQTINLTGHHTVSDVSVFSLSQGVYRGPMEPTSNGTTWGQTLYFLGFPYGMRFGDEVTRAAKLLQGLPMPLVKQALLSAFADGYILLDGINNPGFSGGPVVFREPNKQISGALTELKVCGIISGYRQQHEPVYFNGQPSAGTYGVNTGIIVAYPIEHALSLIEANPNGAVIKPPLP